MNKILISVDKDYICFSKYNRNVNEENLNNTNVIDVKSLKFTEEYILENLELVTTFINLVVLKFNINKVIIKNLDIAETSLKILKNINSIKQINFKEDKILTYTISSLLIENKNLERIECYSLPNIMFNKFNKDQIKTRSKILSTSKFLEYNNIKTFSDLFNKDKITIGEYLVFEDVNPLVYILENNSNIKKIEFKKYNRKNLESVLFYLEKNKSKKVNIIIYEEESTTKNILEDIRLFEKLSKKYSVNIKIKYSKYYKQKNKIKEINLVLLKTIMITCLAIGFVLLICYKHLEKKDSNEIEKINDDINKVINNNMTETIESDTFENADINQPVKEEYISSYYKNYSKVYNELLELNGETIGWITINNTKINYPVVQTTNNEYYLNHAYDKTKNIAGWVYVDYRNDMNSIDKNTIIYGHSGLKGNLMFSSLNKLLNENWYSNENNLNINFSIKGNEYTWRVFSIYTIPVTSDYLQTTFNTEEEYINFITMIKERSINDFNIEVGYNDKILTLSTCYKDDTKRLVVHAKMIY